MRAPLVAVSQRVDHYPERRERRDALDQALGQWLTEAGFLPVPVPNCLGSRQSVAEWLAAIKPVGIVLSGGNDIGQEADRDQTESSLLSEAELQRLPVLGLCRGLQMLVCWAGGRLQPISGHVCSSHRLLSEQTPPFPAVVNSYHNFAVTDLPAAFRVLARSATDGSIEAVGHQQLPFEGWMWHPERESPFSPQDRERLLHLFLAKRT